MDSENIWNLGVRVSVEGYVGRGTVVDGSVFIEIPFGNNVSANAALKTIIR